jgi:ribosomal protein S6--L-glutamate ligase
MGVMFAESFAAASSMLDTLITLRQPFIIQEYIETEGTDIRALVVGDRVAAAMQRIAVRGEKRANIHAGAKGRACELDSATERVAVATAKAIGAEICAVDILESSTGPVVIEVNLSPGLQGITKAAKTDLAAEIAEYLFAKAKEFSASSKKEGASKIFTELGIDREAQLITAVDFRGNRMLLPEVVTRATRFSPEDELVIRMQKGRLHVERLDLKK